MYQKLTDTLKAHIQALEVASDKETYLQLLHQLILNARRYERVLKGD